MKKIFVAAAAAAALGGASAFAAEMPVKALYSKAPLPLYNWTGFYLGANAGVGVSQTSASTPGGAPGSLDRSGAGFAGGAQAGYNWQFAPNWVAGIEGDVGFLTTSRSFLDWSEIDGFGVKANWYSTLRGRFGYTNGPSLFYATGGAAFVHVTNNFDAFEIPIFASAPTFASKAETATGWTAGGGIETSLGGNWSAKAEYLYVDAGSQDIFNSGSNIFLLNGGSTLVSEGGFTAHFDNRFHVYRYGLNYKFGGPRNAVSARPAHNWAGFYAGVNAGAGLSQGTVSAPTNVPTQFPGTDIDLAAVGFTGGAQAGYNWQFSPTWVAGIEGDISYSGIKRGFFNWDDVFPGIEQARFGLKTDWYATLRGRLGYSTGPALAYVTGGAAFVSVENSIDDIASGSFASQSETAIGWTVGGGIEAALAQNWTAKTEYLYIDAGSQDVFNPSVDGMAKTAHFDNRFHIFRFGLNYAFGG